MHYFVFSIKRPKTGSNVSLVMGLPYEDESGHIMTEMEMGKMIYGLMRDIRESETFPGWEVGVRAAQQEDIDQFEEFLQICGV